MREYPEGSLSRMLAEQQRFKKYGETPKAPEPVVQRIVVSPVAPPPYSVADRIAVAIIGYVIGIGVTALFAWRFM
jgi:hypothetical protein